MTESLWIMPFGKHKAIPIEDIETSYLEWLLEQDWFLDRFPEGGTQIKKELAFRETFD